MTTLELPERMTAQEYRREAKLILGKMKTRRYDEGKLQEAVVGQLTLLENQGRLRFFHVPNASKISARQGARLKRQGLRAGVPDIVVLIPTVYRRDIVDLNRTIFLELKAPKGRLSEAQINWRSWLEKSDFSYFVIRSLDDLQEALL